jgi:HSP20 family molecular chaperone IbpA
MEFEKEVIYMQSQIENTDTALIIRLGIPGLKKESVCVEYCDYILSVRAKSIFDNNILWEGIITDEDKQLSETTLEYTDGVLKITILLVPPKKQKFEWKMV